MGARRMDREHPVLPVRWILCAIAALSCGRASAERPPICAALHESEAPTTPDAFTAIEKIADDDEKAVIASWRKAYAGNDRLQILALDAELARRCAQKATTIEDEIDAIYHLDRCWLARRQLDVAGLH